MIKKNINELVTLKADATFENGKKIIGNIAFVTKDYKIESSEDENNNKQFILGKKEFVVEVQDYKAKYEFVIKDLIDELHIKQEDIAYVKGWMDSDGDGKYRRLYDLEVFMEIESCYCNRDFTVDEVKSIVKNLRDSEEDIKGKYNLFTAENCKLPQSEKTYEKFTEELNKTLKKYEINTCLRKIHFLAQAYVESAGFNTTKEYDSKFTINYDPFRGRGIKQITHDYNYLEYYDYINETTFFDIYQKYNKGRGLKVKSFINQDNQLNSIYSSLENFSLKLSDELFYAFDSAGWYWRKNKINKYADEDNVNLVSKKVNLPYGRIEDVLGLAQRDRYTKKLKKALNYEKCKNTH